MFRRLAVLARRRACRERDELCGLCHTSAASLLRWRRSVIHLKQCRERQIMRPRTKIFLLMAVSFFFTLAGYSQTVVVDWDHSAGNFSQFKTYAWVKPVRPTPNPLMDQRIVSAIDS